MHPIVQTSFLFGIGAIAIGLVATTRELRLIRSLLSTGDIRLDSGPPTSKQEFSWRPGTIRAGYAIFVFRQGQWVLEADLSNQGYEAVAPAIAGTFEGQVVKKESGLSRPR